MTCDARDQNLLLLAHNQLSPLARMATLSHLKNCVKCSRREARFTAVSQQIAMAMRPSSFAPWQPAPPANPWVAMPLATKLMIISALLLIALTSALLVTSTVRSHAHKTVRPGSMGVCRPDLPNDQCQ